MKRTLPSNAPDESGQSLEEKARAKGGENEGVRDAVVPKRDPNNIP